MFDLLFNEEKIREAERREFAEEVAQEAAQEAAGKERRLFAALMSCMEPLGRIGELIAASTDESKLNALTKEFGVNI